MTTYSRIVGVERFHETILISLQDDSTMLVTLDQLLRFGVPRIVLPPEGDDPFAESLQNYFGVDG